MKNTYQITLKEEVYGFAFVEADSAEHAREIADTILEHCALASIADTNNGVEHQIIEEVVPMNIEGASFDAERGSLELNMEQYTDLLELVNTKI